MTKHVTVAVVGAGMAGQAHMFGYRNATMHPDLAGVDVRLAAVVNFNEDLARSAAARYGFAAATTDLDAVLGDPAIDAVSLALPNFAYAEVIPKLIAAGKHVLAEKPLGRPAAEAYQFATAADAAGIVHGVGFSFRRLPAVEAVAQIVAAGGIGELGPVSTDDVTTMIAELAHGGSAQVTVSRIATGVANSLGFQVYLQGYEAVDALWLYLANGDTLGGGQTVLTGPSFVDASNVAAVAKYAARGTR